MQACLLLAPTWTRSSSSRDALFNSFGRHNRRGRLTGRPLWAPVVASAAVDGRQNHYAVLGIPPDASSADIKKAYRLLALKYHPDVSKDSCAGEVFKSIRLAYDILCNETTRKQYDQAVRFQEDTSRPGEGYWDYDLEFEDEVRLYRWADLRRRMRRERYWQRHNAGAETSSYDEADEVSDEEITDEERGSFTEVLKSAFLSLFLMQTIGTRLSLTFSSLMAMLDDKLDSGYKVGYFIAWVLGGTGGILLTLCLSFASWVCGKQSSSLVAVVVVAMWIGSNLARFAPLPQGALLTLLYMSIKLQVDLN
ncbi:hypothetical protein RJ639_012042 [Escallonia herrerae]|uniref:J domain-containing protein n=1 Tax=Escallonia herrerae TaxID=1293975 RepID=A0AA88VMK8_9ASTE|nr:hypothetical protein RJ639_012042 [Escallonia herrerae]